MILKGLNKVIEVVEFLSKGNSPSGLIENCAGKSRVAAFEPPLCWISADTAMFESISTPPHIAVSISNICIDLSNQTWWDCFFGIRDAISWKKRY